MVPRLLVCVLCGITGLCPGASLDVFILTGQSNSLGTLGTTDSGMRHDPPGAHPAEQGGGVAFYWDHRTDGTAAGDLALGDSGGWTVVGPQTGGVYAGNDDHWGPEIGFARMLWDAGYRDFAIVKASRGGGGNRFWEKDSADDHMYDHVVATVTAALADLPAGYESHRVAGLLYVQGESNNASEASDAGIRFSELLENLRADLPGAANMAGIIGEIAGSGANRDTTRAAQLALATQRADIGYARSTGLTLQNQDGLNVHYDAESQVLLGARMAAEAIRLDRLPGKPLPAWSALHAWYVADHGSGFDAAGAVNRWAALHDGAASRDLSRRVAGQTFRRTVTAAGAVRRVMVFDGTNDLWANATTEFGAISGGRSVAILCRVPGEGDGFLFDGSTGTGKTRAQVRGGKWQAGTTASSGVWNGAETETTPRESGVWQQHVFTYLPDGSGGTTVGHWIDGVQTASVQDSPTAALGGFIIGANGGSPFTRLAVEIAEVAVYANVLGAAEVAELKSSWDQRWGIPTGPPFSASVRQTPRAIPRFGRHELLEIRIDSAGSSTLEVVEIQLAPGTGGAVGSLHLVTDAGQVLTSVSSPQSDVISMPASFPLAEGTNRIQLAVVPLRHASLGMLLDAAVPSLIISGADAGAITPTTPDPPGGLTLGLVPHFTPVVRSGQGGVHTYRIPGISCDGNGVLHAVYDHRYGSAGDLPGNIDVGYSRSTDGGATWSASRVILDFDASVSGSSGNGVGDPCILHDPVTDTLWVAALWSFGNRGYSGSGPGLLPSETGQYVLVKSSDGGETWSPPIHITTQVKDPAWRLLFCGPGHGLAMRDGTLVFPSQYRDAVGTVRSCFVYSSDHGQNWAFGSAVPTATPQTNEVTVCELDDGRLLFSMRTPVGSNGQRAWSRYSPGGSVPLRDGAWGDLFRLPAVPDPVCQGSVIQWTSTHRGDPREFVVFGNPASTSSRVNFTLRVSPDGGDTWPVSRVLYPGSAAYSALCILPDRSIGVLLETENYTALTFARVEEGWLMNPAADADGDGMPDAWEILHRLNPAVPDGVADPDGDGISSVLEYLAGTDPMTAASALRITASSREALTWQSVPGRIYAVEKSTDLAEWTILPGTIAPASGGHTTVALPADAAPASFYRVRVLP